MSIVRIDPGGGRNAEHIAIIVVVDLVPIQCHFRSRRPQAQLKTAPASGPYPSPLYQSAHTATRPAQNGHRPEGRRPQAQFKTATGFKHGHVPIQSHFRSRRPQAQQLTGERSLPWLPRSREARWSCSP